MMADASLATAMTTMLKQEKQFAAPIERSPSSPVAIMSWRVTIENVTNLIRAKLWMEWIKDRKRGFRFLLIVIFLKGKNKRIGLMPLTMFRATIQIAPRRSNGSELPLHGFKCNELISANDFEISPTNSVAILLPAL
jgi:hypothetical protein